MISQSLVAAACVVVTLSACSAKPVRSASGAEVSFIVVREACAFTPTMSRPSSVLWSGADLARVMPLADQHGLFEAGGQRFDSSVYDGCSVEVTIHFANGTDRSAIVSNCDEPRVCGFLVAAAASGLLPKRPGACLRGAPCTHQP